MKPNLRDIISDWDIKGKQLSAFNQCSIPIGRGCVWATGNRGDSAQNLVEAVAPNLPSAVRSSLEAEAVEKRRQAAEVREIIENLTPFRTL